jgi:hypothetical protein
LTVLEHLTFQALLRLGRNVSYDDKMKRVREVINDLSLKKCENTQIGIPGILAGLSGGTFTANCLIKTRKRPKTSKYAFINNKI